MERKKLDKPVLAEGEVTGHAHVLDADVDVYETEKGTREFDLGKETVVRHEEHKPITLPKKNYTSDRVVEYDSYAEEARRVAD